MRGSPPSKVLKSPALEGESVCNMTKLISFTGAGNSEIIAGVSGDTILICRLTLAFTSMVDFSLHEGTGANCATGDVAITGTFQDVLTVAMDFEPGGALRSGTSQALCVNLGGAVTGWGVVTYARF